MTAQSSQRIWLGAVVVVGILAASQWVTVRGLRAELERTRAQVDVRAREMAVETLQQRRAEVMAAGQWLHEYYRSDEGLTRPEGLWLDGRPDFDGIGAWLFDVYLVERLGGASDEQARQKIVEAIRASEEWRAKHPGR